MTARILITGAGGFFGQPVLRALRSAGHECRGFYGPGDSAELLADDDLVGDICDQQVLARAVAGVDAIIHMAGPPSVARSFQDPAETIRAHALGTALLTEAARSESLRRFVYISSAEVYGQPASNPVSEDAPLQPVSPYGGAKVTAETTVASAAVAGDFSAVMLRPFTIYGPGLRPGSLIDRIVSQAPSDEPISIMDTAPIRDYIWIDDAVAAVIGAVQQPQEAAAQAYNLGTGRGMSVGDIIETAQKIAGTSAPVIVSGQRDRSIELDINKLVANPDRLRDWLGWEPRTTMDAGLRTLLSPTQS